MHPGYLINDIDRTKLDQDICGDTKAFFNDAFMSGYALYDHTSCDRKLQPQAVAASDHTCAYIRKYMRRQSAAVCQPLYNA